MIRNEHKTLKFIIVALIALWATAQGKANLASMVETLTPFEDCKPTMMFIRCQGRH